MILDIAFSNCNFLMLSRDNIYKLSIDFWNRIKLIIANKSYLLIILIVFL